MRRADTPERPIEFRPVQRFSHPANYPFQSRIAARIKPHPVRRISGDSHWDAERIVADSDREYLAVSEVWIAPFQYSDFALGEIDLHDTTAEKSRHPKSHRQARTKL